MVNWDEALKDALESAIPMTAEGWALRYECPDLIAAIRRVISDAKSKQGQPGAHARRREKEGKALVATALWPEIKRNLEANGRRTNQIEIADKVAEVMRGWGFKISAESVRKYKVSLGDAPPTR